MMILVLCIIRITKYVESNSIVKDRVILSLQLRNSNINNVNLSKYI